MKFCRKFLYIAFWILLLISIMSVTVFADVVDSGSTYAQYQISKQGQYSGYDLIWHYGNSGSNWNSAIEYIDGVNFTDRASSSAASVNVSEGFYDFEYVNYSMQQVYTNRAGVIAYAYNDVVIQPFDDFQIQPKSSYLINGGAYNYITSNALIKYIRFSLRDYSSGSIGTVSAATPLVPVYVDNVITISNDALYSYFFQIPSVLNFKNIVSNISPLQCVLCVDFIFVPGSISESPGNLQLMLDIDNNISLLHYYQPVYGPEEPSGDPYYYPALSTPMYSGPNMDDFNKFGAMQETFINNNFDNALDVVKGLMDQEEFISSFNLFSTKLSSMFTFIFDNMPSFNGLISMAILLGIFGFLVNIGSLGIGASGRRQASHYSYQKSRPSDMSSSSERSYSHHKD